MKLSDILFESEDVDVDDFEKMLETELTNVGQNLLYRGIKFKQKKIPIDVTTFKKVDTLDYRPPKDTGEYMNDYIESIGKSIFGNKYISRNKNVVFTTLRRNIAKSFGKVYIIFVPKNYKAISLRYDLTDNIFLKIGDAIYFSIDDGFEELTDYVKLNTNLEKELEQLKEEIYGKNIMYQINELSDIDKMHKKIIDFLNILRGLTTKKSFSKIDDIQEYFDNGFELLEKNTIEYFDSLKFVTAPWEETKAYEIMINCPWYVMVDEDWFLKYFEYNSFENKYVRK